MHPFSNQLTVPVALIIFNRPDHTRQVFEEIRRAAPLKLLVVADGPRQNKPGDTEKCQAARSIIDQVDWPCEVIKNYADSNLGCKLRPASGLDWIFSLVDQAIIFEDDCLPHPTFFRFCEELLERYRYDTQIMTISGVNQLGEWKASQQSYHFTYSGPTTGWATWKRAWQHYDIGMRLWQFAEVQNRIRDVVADDKIFKALQTKFSRTIAGELITWWDYQWAFARLTQSGMAITPSMNLIKNIGFDPEGTHTRDANSPFANMPLHAMEFPLIHPQVIAVNRELDKKVFALRSKPRVNYPKRTYRKLLGLIRKSGVADG